MLAISGVLKRVIVVRSLGPSKTLSLFEIEPPRHWNENVFLTSGVPLIVSHLCDYHYMPVKIRREGLWGWVLDVPDPPKVPAKAEKNELNKETRGTELRELTSSRTSSTQRRSDSQNVEGRLLRSPRTSRISPPQRRLVFGRSVGRTRICERGVGTVAGSYSGTGASMLGRTQSVDKWFAERACSLARGAEESEEEWLSAWGIDRKKKGDGGKERGKDGDGTYAGMAHVPFRNGDGGASDRPLAC